MSVPIYVTAYSGYKGNERPHSFLVEEQLYEVEAILTRWYEPLFACFKLVTTDGKLFVIRYEQTSDQ